MHEPISLIGALGIWGTFIVLFIVAMIGILMPFFIFRIRNEAIKTNKKIDILIELISSNPSFKSVKQSSKNHHHQSKLDSIFEMLSKKIS